MLFIQSAFPAFKTIYSNVYTTRPATAWGTSLTPGQNSYPAYASLSTTATKECFGMMINIGSGASSTNNRDIIVKIGMDPAGGSSYADFISHLLGSASAPYGTLGGGHWYYFPVYVPSGATFAGTASVNNATVGTVRVALWLFADPVNPDGLKYGHRVETIGATTASSSGTAVTSGTASEGSWTSLGTSANTNFYWELGVGCNDGTMSALIYHAELSADNNATRPKILIPDVVIEASSTEQFSKNLQPALFTGDEVVAGATIYGRLQCSGTADSSLSMIAYGVS